jgi:hypothetical protein
MIFEQTYSEKSLYEAILIAFVDDELLMSKYHIFSGTLIECANDTYLKIMDANDRYPLEWYIICDGVDPIGYCVTSKTYSFLYSFGMNITHRTSDNMEEWFDKVRSLFNGSFTCGLWAKNERAIDFLLKNGMNIYDKTDSEIHLKYN